MAYKRQNDRELFVILEEGKDHYTVSEVATILHITKSSVQHYITNGVINAELINEYCGVYRKIEPSFDGSDEIDILRRLRTVFAHTSGFYDATESEHRKLYDRIINHFKPTPNSYLEYKHLFPIPIDEVLEPLVEGCKTYVVELYNRQSRIP